MTQVLERTEIATMAPADERPRAMVASAPALPVDEGFALLQTAVARGVTNEELSTLMALRTQLRAEAAERAFVDAMASFKAEPLTIAKRKEVGYETRDGEWVGYRHAELSDVTAVVCPAMGRNGLSHRWDVQQNGDAITVTCIVTHRGGHSIKVAMSGRPDNSGKKNAIQQIASTVSYLQRYTLMAATGTAAGGQDDDGRGGDQAGQDAQAGGRADEQRQQQPLAYPEDKFREYLPSWQAHIRAGKKTADQIIAFVETKAPLTEQQKAELRAAA